MCRNGVVGLLYRNMCMRTCACVCAWSKPVHIHVQERVWARARAENNTHPNAECMYYKAR